MLDLKTGTESGIRPVPPRRIRLAESAKKKHELIVEPLSKCPECRYLLKGLPAAGRCPECGFFYDPLTADIPTPRLRRPLYVLPLLPIIFGLVTIRQNSTTSIVFVLFGSGLLAILWYFRCRFILARSGVRLVSWKNSKWVAWEKIEEVSVGGKLGYLKIKGGGGRTLFWVLVQDIGGHAFAKQMSNIIEEKRKAYFETGIDPIDK